MKKKSDGLEILKVKGHVSCRTLSKGKLKTLNLNRKIGPVLPKVNGTFVAGDARATENPGLSSLHTIFVREHNRIARTLADLDRSLSDEELYQRARRYLPYEHITQSTQPNQ